jgi:hypothetical protein
MRQIETSGWGSNEWGQEQSPQTAGARLREAMQKPVLQERAKQVAAGIGTEMLVGSGVVKRNRDGSTRISKRGVIKAVLNPQLAAAKAARGATSEARSMAMDARNAAIDAARETAVNVARTAATEAFNTATTGWNSSPNTAQQVANEWGGPRPAQNTLSQAAAEWGINTAPAPSSSFDVADDWGAPRSASTMPGAESWGTASTSAASGSEWGANDWGSPNPTQNTLSQAAAEWGINVAPIAPHSFNTLDDWGAASSPNANTHRPDEWAAAAQQQSAASRPMSVEDW